jgi:hypothetical protein
MKIRPLGAVLFHAGGRTDSRQTERHDEANSRFSQFCECAYRGILIKAHNMYLKYSYIFADYLMT